MTLIVGCVAQGTAEVTAKWVSGLYTKIKWFVIVFILRNARNGVYKKYISSVNVLGALNL